MIKLNIYNSGIFSFYTQIIIQIIDTFALYISFYQKSILKELLFLEYIVNFIEGSFYYWMINLAKNIDTNLTSIRYKDWIFSTPIMLLTLCCYLYNLQNPSMNSLKKILISEYKPIIIIILLNWLMLLCGYLSEKKIIDLYFGVFLGFIPFLLLFYIIYKKFLNKEDDYSSKLFYYTFLIWSIYGIAALQSYNIKNIMYNILDLFAKNFFSLFIALLIIKKYFKI
jgi:bacteriorhodopsin